MQVAYPEKYYEKVKERFPDLTYREIDTIVKFGLRSLFINCGYGGDILLHSPKFTMYIGKLYKDIKWQLKYRDIKKSIKLRIKYKRAKTQWDGYYYFNLNDEEFQEYLSNFRDYGLGNKSKGLRRRKITFHDLRLYKIMEESQLYHFGKHIFKVKYPEDVGFYFKKEKYSTYNAQYILTKKDNVWKPVECDSTKNNKQYVNYLKKQYQYGETRSN